MRRLSKLRQRASSQPIIKQHNALFNSRRRLSILATSANNHLLPATSEPLGSSCLSTCTYVQHAEGTTTTIPESSSTLQEDSPSHHQSSQHENGEAATSSSQVDQFNSTSQVDQMTEEAETKILSLSTRQKEQNRQQSVDDEIRQYTAFVLEEIPCGEFTPETWDSASWLLDKWIKTSRMVNSPESVDQSFVLLDRLVMEQEVQEYHPLSCQRLRTPLLQKMVFNWNRCVRKFHSYSPEDQALLRFEYTPMELLARLENYSERSPRLQLDTRTLNTLMDGASWCSKPSPSGVPHMISPRVATSFVESLFDRMEGQHHRSSDGPAAVVPTPQEFISQQESDTDNHLDNNFQMITPEAIFDCAIYNPPDMMRAYEDTNNAVMDNDIGNSASSASIESQYHPKYVAVRKRFPPPPSTPDKTTYTTMITLFAKNGLAGRAEAHLNRLYKTYMERKSKWLKPDLPVFTAVLQALSSSHDGIEAAERAEAILDRMTDLAECGLIPEVAPDELAYSVVLSCYAKRSDIRDRRGKRSPNKTEMAEKCLARARVLFARMQELGFGSTTSFNIMINALGKAGKPEEAEELLQQMHEEFAKGGNNNNNKNNVFVQPGSIAYNTILTAWARSGDSKCGDRAQELLSEFERHVQSRTVSDPPNLVTYNSVLYCLAQAKEAERAEELLVYMKETQMANGVDVSPDTVSYNTVMDAYAKCKNPKRAEEILETLYKEQRIKPDVQSFTVVLSAWFNSGHQHAAERSEAILRTMHSINDAGVLNVAPTNHAYNLVLACWCKTQDKEAPFRALQVLDTMEELFHKGSATVRPEETAYYHVIRAFSNTNNPHIAEQVLERQHIQSTSAAKGGGGNLRAKPVPRNYRSVLAAYSRSMHRDAPKQAEMLYKRWQSRFDEGKVDFPPDDVGVDRVCAAWANATSHDPHAAQRVKEFLKFVSDRQPASHNPVDGMPSSSPVDTKKAFDEEEAITSPHTAVLDTFAKLKDAPSAHEHFFWICKEYLQGDEAMKPDAESLDRVLTIWRMSKAEDAPAKMIELLEKVKEMSDAKQIDWRPSIKSYRIYLNCLEDVRSMDAGMKAQLMLQDLERMCEATTTVTTDDDTDTMNICLEARDYMQIVRIWTKVDTEDSILLADAAFQRLTQRYTPTVDNYDLLMKAWSRSGHHAAGVKMTSLQAEKAIIYGE